MSPDSVESVGARIRGVLVQHAKLATDVSTLADDADLYRAGLTSHASVNVMLALEDEFDVLIRIVAIAEKTMRYFCLITKGDTKIASGTMTIACVGKGHEPLRSIGIPPGIAARFQAVPEGSERP